MQVIKIAIIRYKIKGVWTEVRIKDAEFEYVEWKNEQEIVKKK